MYLQCADKMQFLGKVLNHMLWGLKIWSRCYHNYQLRKAQRKFGDKVLTLKLRWNHGQLARFPMVTCRTLPFHDLAGFYGFYGMLPMDTKLVARGNDVVLTAKPCHQTSPVPYSNESRSTFLSLILVHAFIFWAPPTRIAFQQYPRNKRNIHL